MKKLALAALLFLLAACARTQGPLLWPLERDSLRFSGVLHSPQGDIPLQGALKNSGNGLRYAVIMQNGILLGTGLIDRDERRAEPVQLAPSAGPAVRKVGDALALFLACRAEHRAAPCDCPWKEVDNLCRFQDKRLELTIPLD